MASAAPQVADPGQTDPLAQLRDIHLPGAIESWAPAPGWWLLGILAICAIAYGLYYLFMLWQRNQYRREGITALKALLSEYENDPETVDYLEKYSQLLKRVALTYYPRDKVASLTGEAWVAFLDQTGATRDFGMGPGQILIEGNYSPTDNTSFPADELHRIAERWIRDHRPLELAS